MTKKNASKKPKLTPAQAEKVLMADLQNILRKVQEGKTLTARQRAIIENARAGQEADSPAVVSTVVDLAKELGVPRRTLTS